MTKRTSKSRTPESERGGLAKSAPAQVSRFPAWLLAALLVLVTVGVYWPAMRCDFVNYDDDIYVISNVHVQNGLNWECLQWAFSNPVLANWHPLTMLSHALDCQLYGLNPWGHHLTSVLLHAANTVLVFLLLRSLTGALWRSVLVAAVFGWHPVHVESVAWIAERKDVLSTFFGFLALLCYARYAKRKSINPQLSAINSPSYWLSLLLFACGLMSKAMLVTWPFVLLLLDYWPLQRFGTSPRAPRPAPFSRLLLEKIPFFLLAAGAGVVTFMVQRQGGALAEGEDLPLGMRGGNALISYGRYLGKFFWPTNLSVFYPHPGHWPLVWVVLAGGLLLGISAVLFMNRRHHPFLLMGWLWFIGTLVPVIQVVQTGSHAMADRYTYIPSLGLLVLVIWGVSALARRRPYGVLAGAAVGLAAVVLCFALTRRQLGYWQDGEALFRHALAITENNYVTHHNLGDALNKKGKYSEAISQFQESLRLKPDYPAAHNNLGYALSMTGRTADAISQFREAVRLQPEFADAHNNLGVELAKQGLLNEAVSHYREAVRLKPDYASAYNNLGGVLFAKGQTDEAIAQFQTALRLKRDYPEAHNKLGAAFFKQGLTDEAIIQFQEAIRQQPDAATAHNNLGAAWEKKGRLDEAIRSYREAVRLKADFAAAQTNLTAALVKSGQTADEAGHWQEVVRLQPENAEAHYHLGNARMTKGRTDEAIEQYQEAIRLKPDFAAACNNLGNALGLKGQTDEAIRHFEAALRCQPDLVDARNNLGNALLKKGRMDEAIRQFQEALRLKPDAADAHNNLGIAFGRSGRIDEAIRQFQEAIRLKPDYAAARGNLAHALELKSVSGGR